MKYIHTILIALLLSTTAFSQDTDKKMDKDKRKDKMESKMESKIESQKIAFITQKLALTPKEAQLFWPIYNEYQAKMKEMRQEDRVDLNIKDVSEEEANDILNNLLSHEQNELDIKKQYLNRLKTAVPARKVAQLYIIEKEFREKILAKIRNKIGQRKRQTRRNSNGF